MYYVATVKGKSFMSEPYCQPEDDGLLLISEMQKEGVKEYIVVCIIRDRNFPLMYLKAQAVNEAEATKLIQKENPLVKVLRAYQAK
jgi:hypothetical protein